MKKIFIILSLFVPLLANTQISVGIKGGISIPDLKGNDEQSRGYTSRMGGYGGILVNFPLNQSLSVQPELNFSPQGGKRKGMQPVPSDAFDATGLPQGVSLYADFKNTAILNYVELPVLIKLTHGGKLSYFACVGPHIALLVEARTKTKGSSLLYLDPKGSMPFMPAGSELPPVSFDSNTNIKESIKSLNAGIQGGLGLEYPAGPGMIFLEGRAILGLTNIQKHPEQDGKNKTGSLAIAAGYQVKIK